MDTEERSTATDNPASQQTEAARREHIARQNDWMLGGPAEPERPRPDLQHKDAWH
jgi:hypothetical protein